MSSTQLPPVIANIYHDAKPHQPRVQITKINPVGTTDGGPPKKYKVAISDGEQYGVAVLNSSCAQLVYSEAVKLHSIVTLKEYIVSTIGATKMCVVMQMDATEDEDVEMDKIGEPVLWDSVPAAENSPQPARPVPIADKAGGEKPSAPTTGQSSRTAPSNFQPQSFPSPATPAAPLVAARATPIEGLNPYSNKWLIKALVTQKSEMRTFSNDKGPSSVFSIDLCDDSGEIRATAWREVAERLYPQIEVGKTYLISRGQLKVANKKFSTLNNTYEMTLSYDTQLQLCADEPATKPKVHYRFVQISDIESRAVNAIVDVIGVVTNLSVATSITTKRGTELAKRTLSISDDSNKAIELTLWGAAASSFPDDAENQIVAFKGLRVTEWNTRSLGSSQTSTFEVGPEVEATERLQKWSEGGGASAVVSLSQDTRGTAGGTGRDDSARLTMKEMQEKGDAATGDQPAYGSVRGYISKHLSGNAQGGEEKPLWYSSCPKCNKKVVGDDASGHSCENCGWSGAECAHRYIVPLVLVDGDSTVIATAFDAQATQLLGVPATELKRLKSTDTAAYEAAFSQAQWKQYVFRIRSKVDTYQNVSRVKHAIHSMTPVSYVSEGQILLKDIARYGYDVTTKAAAAKPEAAVAASPTVKAEA